MPEHSYPTRKLQCSIRATYEQYVLVLPPALVKSLGWKKGDDIELILNDGDIRLHKKTSPEE